MSKSNTTRTIKVDDNKITAPSRTNMKDSMESVIAHFKYFSEGFSIEKGQAYALVEAPKGEFATYLVANEQIDRYAYVLKHLAFYIYKH